MTIGSTTAKFTLSLLLTAATATHASAFQVHHYEDGGPWNQRAGSGPDAEVPGWFYNLGPTGIRVELDDEFPTHLVVRYVFEDSPAAGRVEVGDHIVGVAGQRFERPHRNGYGMEVFGPQGPILDFANALEALQRKDAKGKLELELLRAGESVRAELSVDRKHGAFGATYPMDCAKSDAVLDHLLPYLREQQREDGSFGDEILDTFIPLALLANPSKDNLAAVERNARFHASRTMSKDKDMDGLVNWRYMAAAIVLCEYYQVSKDKWILPELKEIHDFIISSQYTSLSQVNPAAKESHPDSYPTDARQQHGGWGHNPGFEGYGPIAMLTGQGALALSLMQRCGVEIDRERLGFAFDFLARGTGSNGYLWYADGVAGDDDWADMGRTGASAIALALDPWPNDARAEQAMKHALLIGEHPESFPDTHASPIMGMGYAALAANLHPASFRRLMDANRWWFTLSECHDGTFYYQPNRDNSGYGADSRLSASAVTALILSIEKRNLLVTSAKVAR
jgi:hypothetical protein